jgi:hypothetical protein
MLEASLCRRSAKDDSAGHNCFDVVPLLAWEKEVAPLYVVWIHFERCLTESHSTGAPL